MFKKPYKGKRLLQSETTRMCRPGRRIAALALSAALLLNSVPAFAVASSDAGVEYCTCGEVLHTHSDACYHKDLICGLEEQVAHTHEEETCFTQVLDCGEDELHTHTVDECYEQQVICEDESPEHEHDEDTCYESVLVCEKKEVLGHQHDASCLDPDPICGEEEGVAHEHGEDCYTKTITCGSDEVAAHDHDDSCYTSKQTCEDTSEEHVHDADACYTDELSCGLEVTVGHQHGDTCYTSELTCELEVGYTHYHDDSCYSTEYICGMEVGEGHTHSARCYSEEQTCELAEQDEDHVHEEGCWLTINTCGLEEHQYIEGVCPAPEEAHEFALQLHYVDLDGNELKNSSSYNLVLENGEAQTVADLVDETLTYEEVPYAFSYATDMAPADGVQTGNEVYSLSADTEVLTYSEDGKDWSELAATSVGAYDLWLVYEKIPNIQPNAGGQLYDMVNACFPIKKILNGPVPAGTHSFEIIYEVYDWGSLASTGTFDITAIVKEDGTYTVNTPQLTWELLYFDKIKVYEAHTSQNISDFVYDDSYYIITDDDSTGVYIEHYNANGELVSETYGEGAIPQEDSSGNLIYNFVTAELTFENTYVEPKNISVSVEKTLTNNFPAGEYEFPFQVEYNLGDGEGVQTETKTITATVAEDGSYSFDTDAVFSWFADVDEGAYITYKIKEQQPDDSNIIIPDYWYEGEFSYIPPMDLSLSDEVSPLASLDALYVKVEKHFSDETTETIRDEYIDPWYGEEMVNSIVSFENDYVTPPTVTKQVLENDNVSGTAQWRQFTTADFGDTVRYKLTGTMPSNLANYATYQYSIYDSAYGLIIDESSFEVTIDGKSVDAADYTLSFMKKASLTVSDLNFSDIKAVMNKIGVTSGAEAVLEVQYTAQYQKKSSIATFALGPMTGIIGQNSAGITTTSLPDPVVSKANVYSFNVIVNKVDESGTALSGALFKLQKLNDATGEYEDYQAHTDTSTSFTFDGLSAGSYRLIETAVPEGGYAKMDPLDFTITCGENFDTDKTDYEINYDDTRSDVEMSFAFSDADGQGNITFTVTNSITEPAVKKEVLQGEENGVEQWGRYVTADSGDTVQFRLTGSLPSNLMYYDTYAYTFNDSSAISLVPDESSFEVTIGGKDVDPANYTVSVVKSNARALVLANTFTLSFSDIKAVVQNLGFDTVTEETVIEVRYNAQYLETSDIATFSFSAPTGGENSVYVSATGLSGSDTSSAYVYSFNVIVNKVDEEGTALSGALFKLQKQNDATGEYEDYQAHTDTDTSFVFDGLSAGSYRLIETTAPAGGYKKMDPLDFTIICGENFGIDETDYKINYDSYNRDDIELAYSYSHSAGQGTFTFTVANSIAEPTVKKEVLQTNPGTPGVGVWKDHAAVDSDDPVKFRITATMPGNLMALDSYQYTINDYLMGPLYSESDIFIDSSSFIVMLEGNKLESTDYTLTMDDGDQGFSIDFADVKALVTKFGIEADMETSIVVTYTGYYGSIPAAAADGGVSLFSAASTDCERNVARILHDEEFITADSVDIATYVLQLSKLDENGDALTGASFKLQQWNGTEYVDHQTLTEDGTTGVFSSTGIGIGKYRLVETAAPAGYLTMAPVEFEVKCDDIDIPEVTYNTSRTDVTMDISAAKALISMSVTNEPRPPVTAFEVEKEMQDVHGNWDDNIILEGWQDVPSRITGRIPLSMLDAAGENPTLTLYDSMTGVFEYYYYGDIVESITINGETVPESCYTLNLNEETEQDFNIVFPDILATLETCGIATTSGIEIVVEYEVDSAPSPETLAAITTPHVGENSAYMSLNGTDTETSVTKGYISSLYVKKVDQHSGEMVAGATLTLYRLEGDEYVLIDNATSGYEDEGAELAYFHNIVTGRYKLIERWAPDNYILSDEVIEFDATVTVDEDGNVVTTYSAVNGGKIPQWDEDEQKFLVEFSNEQLKITSEKRIYNREDAEWADSATYGEYEDIPYRITGTITRDLDLAEEFSIRFHDETYNKLTLDESSISVTVDGNALPETAYTLVTDCSCGCAFAVDVPNLNQTVSGMNLDLAEGTEVMLSYNMTIGTAAEVDPYGVMPLSDESYYPYVCSNNGWISYDEYTTAESFAYVNYMKLTVKKVDEAGTLLDGASFKLQKWDGTQYTDVEVTPTSTETGVFAFGGIPYGQYKLVETAAPTGYLASDPIEFKIGVAGEYGDPYGTILDKDHPGVYSFTYGGDVTLSVKNKQVNTSIEKKVANYAEYEAGVFSDTTTADDDSVYFRFTATIPSAYLAQYPDLYVEFHDLSEGALYGSWKSKTITINGTNISHNTYNTNGKYERQFGFTLSEKLDEYSISYDEEIEIVVTYRVPINTSDTCWNAVDGIRDTNKVTLNLYTEEGGDLIVSEEDTAAVHTILLSFTKVNENGEVVQGATFLMERWDESTSKYAPYDTFYPQQYYDSEELLYLKPGQYRITEVENPNGYFTAEPFEFIVSYDATQEGAVPTVTSVSGDVYPVWDTEKEMFTVSVVNKSGAPTITKTVYDSASASWGDSTVVEHGTPMSFKLTGTVPANLDDLSSFSYKFHDEATTHETIYLKEDTLSVTIGGTLVPESLYSVITDCEDDCLFEVDLGNIKAIVDSLGVDVDETTTVVVSYDMYLGSPYSTGENSTTAADVMPLGGYTYVIGNVAWIEYTGGRSVQSEVTLDYTLFIANKVDENGNPLSGAAFKLQKWDGTQFVDDITTPYTSDGTSFYFYIIDDVNYRLVETTVPEGYEGAEPIVLSTTRWMENTHKLFIYDENDEIVESVWGAADVEYSVVNSKIEYLPEELPNTGGMGTYLFYGAGAVLLVGGAILVIKKRKDEEDQE